MYVWSHVCSFNFSQTVPKKKTALFSQLQGTRPHSQPTEKHIAAAFRGMHVSPAKHSYAWLQRECDYRTDTQTDVGQSDPYVPLCFACDTKTCGQTDDSNHPDVSERGHSAINHGKSWLWTLALSITVQLCTWLLLPRSILLSDLYLYNVIMKVTNATTGKISHPVDCNREKYVKLPEISRLSQLVWRFKFIVYY